MARVSRVGVSNCRSTASAIDRARAWLWPLVPWVQMLTRPALCMPAAKTIAPSHAG